jgi:CHAT domain-containing protein
VFSQFKPDGAPEDGYLRLNDVFNLTLPVELVVLSACESGQGKLVGGEGLVGLTNGFLYAGAASLTVSLWKVDDRATATLMAGFYRAMLQRDHLRPAAALRQAQLAMIRDRKWSHPRYWAPFIVEGDWR